MIHGTKHNRLKNIARALLAMTGFSMFIQFGIAAGDFPDPIDTLIGIDDNGEITLNWTIPEDNGLVTTEFTIEFDIAGDGFTQSDTTTPAASCTGTAPGSTCSFTLTPLENFTLYEIRVIATNIDGDSDPSNSIQVMPTPCSPSASNEEVAATTVSESCLGLLINEGTLSLENVPDSFIFPRKFSSQTSLNSFSNDNSATTVVDVSTEDEDVITVSDLRGDGGFDLTLTSSTFENTDTDVLPLYQLYVASMYPEDNDLTSIDPDLVGTEVNGVEFAADATSTANITAPVHSTAARGTASNSTQLQALIDAYTNDGSNFDADTNDVPDSVLLMQSTGDRLARMSQVLGFYLNIPADQPPGSYAITFTVDLIAT